MTQAQLDDVPLARVQAVDRVPDELLEFGPFGRDADLGSLDGHIGGLLKGREAFPARSRRRHSLRAIA